MMHAIVKPIDEKVLEFLSFRFEIVVEIQYFKRLRQTNYYQF